MVFFTFAFFQLIPRRTEAYRPHTDTFGGGGAAEAAA